MARLVDKDYKPYGKDHQFSDGDKVTASEDAWCSYTFGTIGKIDGKLYFTNKFGSSRLEVVFDYDPYLQEDTWVLKSEEGE